MTLVNIYRPEMEGADFIHNIFFKFACPITELIIGGDFNVVLDPVLDRSSTKVSPLSQVAKALKYELSSYNLIDIWRFKNKTKKNILSIHIGIIITPELTIFLFQRRRII